MPLPRMPVPRMPAPSGASGHVDHGMVGTIIAAEHALTQRFPDLQPQMDNPSFERLCYDVFATDSSERFTPAEMLHLFIEGPGSMDPERDIQSEAFGRVLGYLDQVLALAYEFSPTFRRLFNYAADMHLHESRWYLAADEAFGATATAQQREGAGHRSVIALNSDPFEAGGDHDVYACAEGIHPFSGMRSYMHEIIHALTGLTDNEALHPRGPVVEYENLVMKELGDGSPARIAYAAPVPPQPGTEEVNFSSIDFGDAFSAAPPS